jgi:hypothetical protein
VQSNQIGACVSNCVLNSTLACRRSAVHIAGGKEAAALAAAAGVSNSKHYYCGESRVTGRAFGGNCSGSRGVSSSGSLVVQCIGHSGTTNTGGRKWKDVLKEAGHSEDPCVYLAAKNGGGGGGGAYDLNLAWELFRQDVLYLDWKARHDVSAILAAHDKVQDRHCVWFFSSEIPAFACSNGMTFNGMSCQFVSCYRVRH